MFFDGLPAIPMEARTRLNMVNLMYSKISALKLDALCHDGEPGGTKLSHLSVRTCSAAIGSITLCTLFNFSVLPFLIGKIEIYCLNRCFDTRNCKNE